MIRRDYGYLFGDLTLDYQTWKLTKLSNISFCSSGSECWNQNCKYNHGTRYWTKEGYQDKVGYYKLIRQKDSLMDKYKFQYHKQPAFLQWAGTQFKDAYKRFQYIIHIYRTHQQEYYKMSCSELGEQQCKKLGYYKQQQDPRQIAINYRINKMKKLRQDKEEKFMDQIITFGKKHYGKTWKFVQKYHPQDIDWYQQNLQISDFNKDIAYIILQNRRKKPIPPKYYLPKQQITSTSSKKISKQQQKKQEIQKTKKIKKMQKMRQNPSFMNQIISFGKYKDKKVTWAEAQKTDKKYITYLATNQKIDNQNKDIAKVILQLRQKNLQNNQILQNNNQQLALQQVHTQQIKIKKPVEKQKLTISKQWYSQLAYQIKKIKKPIHYLIMYVNADWCFIRDERYRKVRRQLDKVGQIDKYCHQVVQFAQAIKQSKYLKQLQHISMLIRHPLLKQQNFDKLAQTLNQMPNLIKITILIPDNRNIYQIDKNNWTQKLKVIPIFREY